MSNDYGRSDGKARTVLLYSCSGAANVAEVADRAARQLMADGCGMMWCLAGIGGGIDVLINQAKSADLSVVIDGCSMDCARAILARAGIEDTMPLRVTDLGIEKVKGERATDEQVEQVVAWIKALLAKHRS